MECHAKLNTLPPVESGMQQEGLSSQCLPIGIGGGSRSAISCHDSRSGTSVSAACRRTGRPVVSPHRSVSTLCSPWLVAPRSGARGLRLGLLASFAVAFVPLRSAMGARIGSGGARGVRTFARGSRGAGSRGALSCGCKAKQETSECRKTHTHHGQCDACLGLKTRASVAWPGPGPVCSHSRRSGLTGRG